MSRGRFVSLEGGEGCGKSTQALLLAEWLRDEGVPVTLTREPGGTPGAEAIRRLLLDPPKGEWDAPAEALLFAAARSDHVARLIDPALATGNWVVCDRFLDSSVAYQGAASGLGNDTVHTLHRIGSGGLMPDLTILLRLDEDTASARVSLRDAGGGDAISGRDANYHRKVANAFIAMAESEPRRWMVVDASGTPEQVHDRVRAAVEPLFHHRDR